MSASDDLMQYHAAELLAAHSSLDKANVPRRCPEGEKLSISQRCTLAANMVLALAATQALMARCRG